MKIKEYRKKRKLTQQQLANLVGKSRGVIAKYELGMVRISAEDLRRIARVLGVPMEALFDDEDPPCLAAPAPDRNPERRPR